MTTPDPNDQLLQSAIERGEVPAGAPSATQEELADLLRLSRDLRQSAAVVDAEARASMPTARARFQRFVAESERAALPVAPPVVAKRPQPGFFGRIFAHRAVMGLSSAAAVAVVVIVALVLSQSLSGVDSAQAWSSGDYVQIEGVVSNASTSGDSQMLTVTSQFGDVQVSVPASTPLSDVPADREPAVLKPGDTLIIGGVASSNRAISAGTLAVKTVGQNPQAKKTVKELKQPASQVEGRVVSVALDKDSKTGRVVIVDANGNHFLAVVPPKAIESLLANAASAIGSTVRLRAGTGSGLLDLEAAGATPQLPPSALPTRQAVGSSRPALVNFEGIVRSRDGNVLTIETLRGPAQVVIRPVTRILVGESGLTVAQLTDGSASAVGHLIHITGSTDPKTNRVLADIVVVGVATRR